MRHWISLFLRLALHLFVSDAFLRVRALEQACVKSTLQIKNSEMILRIGVIFHGTSVSWEVSRC